MESITQGDLIARKCRDKVRNLLEEIKPQQSDAAIDVIALARKALAFSTEVTEHDDDRRDAYSLLAAALRRSCEFQTNLSFVMESIELERKALDLCAHGHPYRATACENLAKSLLLGFDNNADDLLLFEAQGLQREALATLSADDSRRVASCVSLANVLNKCHGRTGDEHILDEIINLDREVLSLRPVGHPNRAWSCNILANSIWRRTESGADNRLLDEVVDLRREALALCPVEDPNRADFCGSLAFSLEMCHRRSGNDRLLDEAIDLQREVLAILPAEHPGRAFHCTNLSISLQTRYNSNGDDQLLDEAIDIQREALALHPPEPLGRTMCSGHLAMLLKTRYQSCGEDRLLNEAIDMERQALALSPAGYPNRVMYCGNLANSLWTLYDRTRDDRVLNEALDLEREALALQPAGHPNRGIACNNLAMSLQSRFQSSRDGQFLDEAIDLQREALALRPVEHPERAMSCNNLAVLLWSRYDRTGDDRLQDEALKLEREALALRPAGHPKRTLSCNNLANSLWRCYKQSGDVGFLDEAIDLDREALALNPAGHPGRADSCTNLSASLSAHYKHSGDGQLLDEAIILEREAFALRPAGHPDRAMACGNLASALRKCYERGDDDHLLHEIFALQQEAGLRATASAVWRHFCILSWVHLQQRNAPFYNVEEAVVCLSKSIEIEPDEIVAFVGVFLLRLNDVWHHDGAKKHTELTNIYRRFINLMPLLANPALDMLPQLQALKSCTGLGSDAFVNAALAGDWPSGFETLELAQGVIWSQSLHRRDPQLEDVPKPLASKLEKLLRDMSTGSIAHLDERERLSVIPQDVLHAQSSQAYELVREIRALPGLDRFMFGETHDTLCGAASTHPVIVLVGARGYFYALILTASLPSGHVLLPLNLTDRDLDILLHTAGSTRARHAAIASESIIFQGERGMHKTKRTNSTPLDQQLETLWHKIVRPILEHLGLKPSLVRDRPRLHWSPTGIFSALPLHAAGIYEGKHRVCCADFVVSSYTPTVTTLLRAQRAASPLRRSDLALALVAEKRAHDRTLQVIYGVDTEIEHVATIANSSSVKVLHHQAGATTVAGTAAAMQAANIVHLACHGIQDVRDATRSGFCLGDGRLTVAGLTELKLDNAFLAFLSACETAKGDQEQPDQVMHLAAAMLFSGFKSVVATMWAISDVDGPNVAKWFYEELFTKEVVDADGVACALDVAVDKLRNSGVGPQRWAPFIHMGA